MALSTWVANLASQLPIDLFIHTGTCAHLLDMYVLMLMTSRQTSQKRNPGRIVDELVLVHLRIGCNIDQV